MRSLGQWKVGRSDTKNMVSHLSFPLSQWQEVFPEEATPSAWFQYGDTEESSSWAFVGLKSEKYTLIIINMEIWESYLLLQHNWFTHPWIPTTSSNFRQTDRQTVKLNSSPNLPWCSEWEDRHTSQGEATYSGILWQRNTWIEVCNLSPLISSVSLGLRLLTKSHTKI